MSNLKLGGITLVKYILSILMCFLVTFSFVAIFIMTSAEVVGYHAAVRDGDKAIEQYTHYYSDGDDLKKADAEAKGYTVEKIELRGELEGTPFVLCHVLSQIISLVLFVAMTAKSLNTQGRLDRNAVNCGRAEEDMLRGVKIGLFPAGLSFISWALLLLNKFNVVGFGYDAYRFANYHFFGYQKLIFGSVAAQDMSITMLFLALLPTVLTLAVCAGAYTLGYKDISLYEKAVYKK